MKTINLVTVSPETRRIIKKQVISLIKKGKKQIEIAETVGISPQAVKRISSVYKKEGTACLKEKSVDANLAGNACWPLHKKRKFIIS